MNNKRFDLIVYIGRFQPFHIAHQETIRFADTLANNVLVLIGSADTPRTIKNPWTVRERHQMIVNSIHVKNLYFDKIYDWLYDENRWITEVGSTIKKYCDYVKAEKVAIIGHDKDHSSYYLNYFPQYEFIEMLPYPEIGETIDSTKIRNLLFENDVNFIKGTIPYKVFDKILEDKKKDWFSSLVNEYKYIKEYKKAWSHSPFPPTFNTVDAVVIQSGHILLIERGEFPSKGLTALPGGFVGQNEKLEDAVLRELREETKIKVPEKVLRGSIVDKYLFDDPNRSTRGRTFSQAYYIKLDDSEKLPHIRGADDAKLAKWIPLGELKNMRSKMMEDHFHIINHMLNRN